jgi:hypothetical protein
VNDLGTWGCVCVLLAVAGCAKVQGSPAHTTAAAALREPETEVESAPIVRLRTESAIDRVQHEARDGPSHARRARVRRRGERIGGRVRRRLALAGSSRGGRVRLSRSPGLSLSERWRRSAWSTPKRRALARRRSWTRACGGSGVSTDVRASIVTSWRPVPLRRGDAWRVLAFCTALVVIPTATVVACSGTRCDGASFECANEARTDSMPRP